MFRKVLIFALVFMLAFSCMIPCAFAAVTLPSNMPEFPDIQNDNIYNNVYPYAKQFLFYTEQSSGKLYYLYTIMSKEDVVDKVEFYFNEDGKFIRKYYNLDSSEHLYMAVHTWADYGTSDTWAYSSGAIFYHNNTAEGQVQIGAINPETAIFLFSDYDIKDFRPNAEDEYFFELTPLTLPLQETVKKTLEEEMKGLTAQMMVLVIAGVCCLACLICLPLLKKVLNRFL